MAYSNAIFYLDRENGSDTARTALTSVTVSNPSGTITRCNKTAHGLVTGAVVDLTLFSTWVNGAWKITVVDADNFDLDGAVWQTTADASGTVTPRGGSSKADAWKTFASGATAARHQAGDTIRVMASPAPTSIGNATWTKDSKTVTLASAVTADIDTCESAWTASANVTATTTSTRKEGSLACSLAVAAGFTTGKIGYFATGTLDLSAYKQVSLWLRGSIAIAAGVLELRLCSDTAGVTAVNTIAIPAIGPTTSWTPITVDTGAALGSSIQSIALYAVSDPGTITILLDNIIACKDSASADSLTLTSLIAKEHCLYWQASTAFAANAIRKPTPGNHTGFQYKVTAGGGGNSGSSEPAWPEYIGGTVTDGALTWTCDSPEDTWYGLQSIRGTTVMIDNDNSTLASAGRGYSRETETIASYKRETIKVGPAAGNGNVAQNSGTLAGGLISYIGGWDRTNMTAMDGETWMDNQSRSGTMYVFNSRNFVSFENLHAVRCDAASNPGSGTVNRIRNCHGNHNTTGLNIGSDDRPEVIGCTANNNFTQGHSVSGSGPAILKNIVGCGNLGDGIDASPTVGGTLNGGYWLSYNNGAYGVNGLGLAARRPVHHVQTRSNATAGVRVFEGNAFLQDAKLEDTTPVLAPTAYGLYLYSHRHGQVANDHRIYTLGATIQSATDQRHTASGISWKFSITSTGVHQYLPVNLSVAKVLVEGGTTKTISIWARRDSSDIKAQLRIAGGQAPGEELDLITSMEPTTNTWVQYSISVSPTEDAVFEVMVDCWDGVGTTNNYWVDDVGVA